MKNRYPVQMTGVRRRQLRGSAVCPGIRVPRLWYAIAGGARVREKRDGCCPCGFSRRNVRRAPGDRQFQWPGPTLTATTTTTRARHLRRLSRENGNHYIVVTIIVSYIVAERLGVPPRGRRRFGKGETGRGTNKSKRLSPRSPPPFSPSPHVGRTNAVSATADPRRTDL